MIVIVNDYNLIIIITINYVSPLKVTYEISLFSEYNRKIHEVFLLKYLYHIIVLQDLI